MKPLRCAVYTRKSTEDGLEQEFNSLDAQREACEAYILSQRHEGWTLVPGRYDDGGYSGGNMERPGLKALLAEMDAGQIDVIVVYNRLDRAGSAAGHRCGVTAACSVMSIASVAWASKFQTENWAGMDQASRRKSASLAHGQK